MSSMWHESIITKQVIWAVLVTKHVNMGSISYEAG